MNSQQQADRATPKSSVFFRAEGSNIFALQGAAGKICLNFSSPKDNLMIFQQTIAQHEFAAKMQQKNRRFGATVALEVIGSLTRKTFCLFLLLCLCLFPLLKADAADEPYKMSCSDYWTIVGFAIEQHRIDFSDETSFARLYKASLKEAMLFLNKQQTVFYKKEAKEILAIKETAAEVKQCHLYLKIREMFNGKSDQPVAIDMVLSGALNGLLKAMDPHSKYYTAAEFAKYANAMDGKDVGVGVGAAKPHPRGMVIKSVLPKTSAAEHLRLSDIVFSADGKDLSGMKLTAIKKIIDSGKPGSTVMVKVRRDDETLTLELTRGVIEISYVSGKRIPEKSEVCYIQLGRFAHRVAEEVRSTFIAMNKQEECTALILDLSYNGGGKGSEELALAEMFVKGKYGGHLGMRDKLEHMKLENEKPLTEIPLAVLINSFSASASEMFSGTMLDYQRAVLIGTTSFGKGTGQTPYTPERMKDILGIDVVGMVKITREYFYSPAGISPQNSGFEPHFVVKTEEEEQKQATKVKNMKEAGETPVLYEKDFANALPSHKVAIDDFQSDGDLDRIVTHIKKNLSGNDQWQNGENGFDDGYGNADYDCVDDTDGCGDGSFDDPKGSGFDKKYPHITKAAKVLSLYSQVCSTYKNCSIPEF